MEVMDGCFVSWAVVNEITYTDHAISVTCFA
jgi:hypothetical protein